MSGKKRADVALRSPQDPRPATADPVGTTRRVVADDGQVEVWRLVYVESSENDRKIREQQIAAIEHELSRLDDWDAEDVAQAAVEEGRRDVEHRRASLEIRLAELKEKG